MQAPETLEPPIEPADAPMPITVISMTPPAVVISLDEFCREFSKENRHVALLGAFHFEMKRKQRRRDTASAYRAAFAAFAAAPA